MGGREEGIKGKGGDKERGREREREKGETEGGGARVDRTAHDIAEA